MLKQREFGSVEEVQAILASVTVAAEAAVAELRGLIASKTPLELLGAVKFERIGSDPLNPARELNLIEQVNQTFTCLVTARALEYLFEAHPSSAPFQINPATAPGSDICSADGMVAAECFAATHPGSNQKLKKDVAKVRGSTAAHRYVFFHSPGEHPVQDLEGVRVIPLTLGNCDYT